MSVYQIVDQNLTKLQLLGENARTQRERCIETSNRLKELVSKVSPMGPTIQSIHAI